MKGKDLLAELRRAFDVSSNLGLSPLLGMTSGRLYQLEERTITPKIVASLIKRASSVAMKSIRPIVEFFPIDRAASKHRKRVELFAVTDDGGNVSLYREGLRKELLAVSGVYVFFDSRGRALYVGKARAQNLWIEMRNAFNRDRDGLQEVYRAHHPSKRNVAYRGSDEKARQIRSMDLTLHELAAYFSAYEVAEPMIDDLEALLVRSFANDLLNKKMERFTQQRTTVRTQRTAAAKTARRKLSTDG